MIDVFTNTEVKEPISAANTKLPKNVLAIAEAAAAEYNVDPDIIKGIIHTESRGRVNAVSPKGAVGPMQLMPTTARELGVKNINDPTENIRGGVRYYKKMREQFGDDNTALAAYNAGPGNVSRGVIPAETKAYVPNVLSAAGRSSEVPRTAQTLTDVFAIPATQKPSVKSVNAVSKPANVRTPQEAIDSAAFPGEVALSTLGATAGFVGGAAARGIEVIKSKLAGETPERQRERGIAAQDNMQNILSYTPRGKQAKNVMEGAGKVVDFAMQPFREAGALIKESWDSPLMDAAVDFGADMAGFWFLGKGGKIAKGKVKEVPQWWNQMTNKERGLVIQMQEDIRSGKSTAEEVRQAWKENKPGVRDELRSKYAGTGDTKAEYTTPSEGTQTGHGTDLVKELPPGQGFRMQGENVQYGPELTGTQVDVWKDMLREQGKVEETGRMLPPPTSELPSRYTTTPEVAEASKIKPVGTVGEDFTVKPSGETVLEKGYTAGELPATDLPVEYKTQVNIKGKPFKTEDLAEKAALQKGMKVDEFDIVPVEDGFGYKKIRVNKAEAVVSQPERSIIEPLSEKMDEPAKSEEPKVEVSPKPVEEVSSEQGRKLTNVTDAVTPPAERSKIDVVAEKEPVKEALPKADTRSVLTPEEIDARARQEVARMREEHRRKKAAGEVVEDLEGKPAELEEIINRPEPTTEELARRDELIKEADDYVKEVEKEVESEVTKVPKEKLPAEMSDSELLADAEKVKEVDKALARLRVIEERARQYRVSKLKQELPKKVKEPNAVDPSQFDLSTRAGLDAYRKAKATQSKASPDLYKEAKSEGTEIDWEKQLKEEGFGELNFGDEVGRAYILEDFSRVVAKTLHDVGVAVWETGKKTFFEWKKGITDLVGKPTWEKYKKAFVGLWDKVIKPLANEKGSIQLPTNRFLKDIGKQSDEFLGVVSTRLKNIAPAVMYRMRKFEFNTGVKINRDVKKVEPFIKKNNSMTTEDSRAFELARKTSDGPELKRLVTKYKMGKVYHAHREVLDALWEEAKSVGLKAERLPNYHPRRVKDAAGLLDFLYKQDDWSIIDHAIREKSAELGRDLTSIEQAELANAMLRGYGPTKIRLSKPGQMKFRSIKDYGPEIDRFYETANESLFRYISDMHQAIEARKLFGKGVKSDTLSVKDSIGHYLMKAKESGKLSPSQERALREMIDARFNALGPTEAVAVAKNVAYIDVLGSFTSAITQVGDLAWSMYKNGVGRTVGEAVKNIAGKSEVKRSDIGVEKVAAEFADTSKISKLTDRVFKLSGLTRVDALGKETLINGALNKARSLAKSDKGIVQLEKELKPIFGKETASVIEDFKSGKVTDNVKLYLFNVLSDFQPVSLMEMPQKYLTAGNGRILYMLKTFTIKQFDVFRREAFQKIATKGERLEGTKNLIRLAGYLTLCNASADVVKDLLRGKPIKLSDTVVDNAWRLAGATRYTIDKAKKEGVAKTIMTQAIPPSKGIDSAVKDIQALMSDKSFKGSEAVRSIPLFGEMYYWWFGKGSKKLEKESRKAEDVVDKPDMVED